MEENRPDFRDIKSFEEFNRYYWYREELSQICKYLGLEYRCTKKELNHIIEQYFKGNRVEKVLRKRNKTQTEIITLNTSLLECGFSFNQKFRDYFSAVTGVNPFKFNADMAREGAKHSNDAAKKYQKMARIVGLPAPTPKVGVANLIAEIQRLLKYMDRPQCMSECGVSVEEFNKHREEIVRRALADACTQANPRKVTAEDINKILDHIAK